MSRYGSRTRVGQAVSDFGQLPSAGLSTIVVDFTLVAGGAAGGRQVSGLGGGGGGAGGYLTSGTENNGGSSATFAPLGFAKSTNIPVVVGAGGAEGSYVGNSGADSTLDTFIVAKGGGGGGAGGTNGPNGAIPGGGASYNASGATFATSGVLRQGNAGGNHTGGNNTDGVGGGGAGGASSNNSATGGTGKTSSLDSVARGGGGAGGGGNATSGGGNSQTAGTVNTGGGGGGSRTNDTNGKAGGSGICVLRYLTSQGTITIGAGLTGSTAPSGDYTVATITAGSGNVSWA